MQFGPLEVSPAEAIAVAVALAIMLAGLVDVARIGAERFAAAGRQRWRWIALIVMFGPLAVLLYAAAVRPAVLHPERYADDTAPAA